MFERTADEAAALQAEFVAKYEEALKKAQEIRAERAKGYNNTGIVVVDYFVYGIKSAFYEVWKKMLRIKSLLDAPEGYKADAPIEDSIIDAINYLAFMYAMLQKEKPRRSKTDSLY